MRWMSIACLAAAFFSHHVQAAVSLSGTRLVFDGRFREVAFDISNPERDEVLVQAWLERGETEPLSAEPLPFVVTPALVRLPAQGRQTLRLMYEGRGLSADRESLLHLYVLEIPRRSVAPRQMNLAVRQRINVFYRPTGLAGDPADAVQALAWQRDPSDPKQMNVTNPTPYHVSLLKISVGQAAVRDDLMLPPFSSQALQMPATQDERSGTVPLTFKALTDYGAQRDFCAPLKDATPANARLQVRDSSSPIGKC